MAADLQAGNQRGTGGIIVAAEGTGRTALRQGTAASIMVAVGSWGVGWLPYAQESVLSRNALILPLRTETVGVIICTLLLAAGSVLLFRAWLRLRQSTKHLGDQALAVLQRAVWWWGAPLLLCFPILSQDVYSYLGQGRLMHAGLSPYEHGVSQLPGWFAQGADSLWAESSSPYGPLFLLYARFAYFLSGGVPEFGVLLLRLVAAAGVLLCLSAVPRLAAALKADASWCLWVAVLNPLFLLNMLGGVHNDGLMLGAALWAFVMAYAKRPVLAVCFMALSIAIKPVMLIILPFLGLAMLPREAGLGAKLRVWIFSAAACAVVLGALGAATGLWFGWIGSMATSGAAAFPYAPVGLLGLLIGWIASLFGAGIMDTAQIVYAGFKLIVVGIIAWLALRRPAGEPLLYAGYGLAASVLLAPIIQPWYLLWLIPFFAIGRRFSVRAERALYIFCIVLVLAGVIDQLSVAQWFSLWFMRIIAAAVSLACVGYMVFIDPKTAPLFGHFGTRASERTRKILRIPNPEETKQQDV